MLLDREKFRDFSILDHIHSTQVHTPVEVITEFAENNPNLEGIMGSIEVGKKADIVVLSNNLFEIDTEEIPNVEIEMTFFEGKRVH